METTTFKPTMNIVESEREISLYIEMPGVNKDAIDYHIDKSVLNVNGLVIQYLEDKVVGRYNRQFRLSNSIDTQRIVANKEEGRVVLNLPKMRESNPSSSLNVHYNE